MNPSTARATEPERKGLLDSILWFCLKQRLATLLLVAVAVGFGVYAMPFDRTETFLADLPSDPVPVDAIPDIGEKQQIVFTTWSGRSPQDVEDQVTYPLVSRLLGVPGVKTVRASSMFGFSSVYVIFDDDADYYQSRTRVLEKLQTVSNALPDGARVELGPDATALGQIFWYTLEGEGFDLDELRTLQDFTLKDALLGIDGVAEVASVGGMQREIQVDVDPEAMHIHRVRLAEVEAAVAASNLDVGAREVEMNGVEYFVRGVGFVQTPEDVGNAVIRASGATPLFVKNIATVRMGPAPRRGALDKGGAEVVGGVVTARVGANPQEVAAAVKRKLEEIRPALPSKTLEDGSQSQVRVVPFYDRSVLIAETLHTLQDALSHQVLICVLVILLLLFELRSAMLVAVTLPAGVLMAFGMMKVAGVDSNIMSLGGIIIAIGTMVDLGIIVIESMVREREQSPDDEDPRFALFRASRRVAGAVLTAVATTIVSFLPVFAMSGAEARMFTPLAFTKTFALIASVLVGLTLLPALASFTFRRRQIDVNRRATHIWEKRSTATGIKIVAYVVVAAIAASVSGWAALVVALLALRVFVGSLASTSTNDWPPWASQTLGPLWNHTLTQRLVAGRERVFVLVFAFIALLALTQVWKPFGLGASTTTNFLFVAVSCGLWLGALWVFLRAYPRLLELALDHTALFLTLPAMVIFVGALSWLGAANLFAFVPAALDRVPLSLDATGETAPTLGDEVRESAMWRRLDRRYAGMQKEFMPALDEGTFLYMPTVMPHAGIGEALDLLQKMDAAIAALPEVETVVGKVGRADSPLDPAPLSMFEIVVQVKAEFGPLDDDTGERTRQWRDKINTLDDVWQEIARVGAMPGTTSAPKLMPIETRLVMLQSGMRAPLGVKVFGKSLADLEQMALDVELHLRSVPGIDATTVQSDRVVGKPYLEIRIDRKRAARYGVRIADAQRMIQTALGGRTVTTTTKGRERIPVRVRYPREARDSLEAILRVLVPVQDQAAGSSGRGAHVPLSQVATVETIAGPLAIKSEDGFLVAYVTFGLQKKAGEVEVAVATQNAIAVALEAGTLRLPVGALKPKVAGTYENQVRSEKTLQLVLPLALVLIFVLLLLQFGRLSTSLIVFSQVAVAWGGGFIFLALWSSAEGATLSILGVDIIAAFAPTDVKLSVAVWVGFIALFGIASDDGVVMATYLDESFERNTPKDLAEVRAAVMEGALRRIRPCLMTTATTVLALLPVLTSHGRGSDVMTPMALPTFGGMLFELLTLFVVPVLYAQVAKRRVLRMRAD